MHAAVEFGFQRTNYSISEEPRLRGVGVCVTVNTGTLERGIEISFNVIDITAESINYLFLIKKHVISTVAKKGHVHYPFHYFLLPISSFLVTIFQFGYFSFPILSFLITNFQFGYFPFPIW
jgi:hypothetical protein